MSLEIIFSTKTYSNRITKRPKIVTNEGPPDKGLQIIANVIQRPDSTYPVVISPYKLDVSQFTSTVRDRITFTITNVSEMDLQPELIYMQPELFELELPYIIPARGRAEGLLILKKEAVGRSFEKSITIQFNDEKASRFTIPVRRALRITK